MKPRVNVVIPAAGAGRRMRSFGPKGSIPINTRGESIVSRQLRLLARRFEIAQCIIVAGFRPRKLIKTLPADPLIVLNENHEETNVAHSICLGLQEISNDLPTIVVYGDLVFTSKFISEINVDQSNLLLDSSNQMSYDEVGVNIVSGNIASMFYGLPTKWVHVAVMHPNERDLFISESLVPGRLKYYGFEIINAVIDRGGVFSATRLKKGRLVEVDTTKDIQTAKALVKGDRG